MAERRLRDVQPLGGPPEVSLLGDRDEVAQKPQVELIDRRNLPISTQFVLDVGVAGRRNWALPLDAIAP